MFENELMSRLIVAAISVLFAATSQSAEKHNDDVFDEIIVSADYRGRPTRDIPLTLSVIDAEMVSGAAVQHFEELTVLVPNMNWSGDGHRARYFQIRGVGELAQYQGAPNPSVGFVIDDIDFSGIGTVATLFDIERIEVLRGPQGTRYGANALAGLIYIESEDPSSESPGRVTLSAGDDSAYSAGVAFGGQVGDDSRFRVSAHHYESDGHRRNPFLGRDDTNGRKEIALRGKFVWQASDELQAKLSAMYVNVDNGYDAFAIDNSFTVLSDNPGQDAQDSIGASVRLDWVGADAFQLTSISSLADSQVDFSFDADWGNADAWAPVTYDFISENDRKRTTLSQEVRLASTENGRILNGRTDWLVGVYVSQLDESLLSLNQGQYFDPGSGFSDSLDARLSSDFEATNSAVFGQLGFPISEAGTLSVGLRVEHRKVDYTDSDGLDLDPSETMLGGEVSYTHRFGDSISGFATLSRGFKAGGFNLGFVPDGSREFDQESLTSLEFGVKSVMANGTLFFSSTVFYSSRRDQQVETSFQIDPTDPASFVFFTDNAAQGRAFGLESDLRWHATEELELYAAVGFLQARFDNFSTPLVDLGDRDQAHAPRYSLAGGGTYRHASGIFARLDVSAKDDFFFDVSHDQKSDAYWVANLRVGYAAESWTAQLYARNLFDEKYAVRGFFFGNEPPNFPPTLYIRQGDPRQVGLKLDYNF